MKPAARLSSLLGLAFVAAALVWAYWPTLEAMAEKWSNEPQYSHGFLVPAFAAYLLWHRRRLAPSWNLRPAAWGLVLIGCGVAMHVAGAYIYFDGLGMLSLLPLLAGIGLCWGGWPALRWSWPAIGFLCFMLPLPYRAEIALSHPLQRLATIGSTYALQTLGFAAVSEGNVIVMENGLINVVEACSGLGMLMTFFAMTTAAVLVVKRSWLEKALLLPSAIPIALIANGMRITATGMFRDLVNSQVANDRFHDWAGLLMMPVALVLLYVELKLLSLLLLDPEPEGLPVLGFGLDAGIPVDAAPRMGEKVLLK